MFNHKHTDIVVLGAGPVGLTAAHALAKKQMDYVLLDREQRTNTHSYALALHPETLELLDTFDLADQILAQSLQLPRIRIYENDHEKAVLDYSLLPLKYPFLTVISQGELEHILVDHLPKQPLWQHRVRQIDNHPQALHVSVDRLMEGMTGYAVAHIELQIDKILDYQANYLIGADGYASVARRSAGIDFPEVTQRAHYAVFEFATDAEMPDEMRIMIQDQQTHIFWPLPNGHCRWSFQIPSNESLQGARDKDHHLIQPDTHSTPTLERAHLIRLLGEHAPWFQGSIGEIQWRAQVPFEQRLANAFGKDRIWLAGDSAHMTPHAGILSMNVGMREAFDLVERLSTQRDDPARQAALRDYNQHRLAEWEHLLDLDHHISAVDQTARWVLGHRSNLIGNIPASGETLTELLAQLHLIDAA